MLLTTCASVRSVGSSLPRAMNAFHARAGQQGAREWPTCKESSCTTPPEVGYLEDALRGEGHQAMGERWSRLEKWMGS